MQYVKRITDTRFRNLQNEKTLSGLWPVQSVSLQYVRIVGLQHKGECMSFLLELSP